MLSAQTLAGRLFLPGRPFDVTSDRLHLLETSQSDHVINHGNGMANAATSQR